jgi:hypothetical protein
MQRVTDAMWRGISMHICPTITVKINCYLIYIANVVLCDLRYYGTTGL